MADKPQSAAGAFSYAIYLEFHNRKGMHLAGMGMQRLTPSFNPGSELSREEQQLVHQHTYSLSDYVLAIRTFLSIGMGLPDHRQLEMAARLFGAVPERIPGGRESPLAMWIFAETSLLLGRN